MYGASLSKQDDWNAKSGTIAGTAHTQEYLLLHLAMFPIGLHAWSNVLGMPTAHQLQAQIIYTERLQRHPKDNITNKRERWMLDAVECRKSCRLQLEKDMKRRKYLKKEDMF